MPYVDRDALYQTLLDTQLLPELKTGPTAIMLSIHGELCRVSLTYDCDRIIAESDDFVYTYNYPCHLKGD